MNIIHNLNQILSNFPHLNGLSKHLHIYTAFTHLNMLHLCNQNTNLLLQSILHKDYYKLYILPHHDKSHLHINYLALYTLKSNRKDQCKENCTHINHFTHYKEPYQGIYKYSLKLQMFCFGKICNLLHHKLRINIHIYYILILPNNTLPYKYNNPLQFPYSRPHIIHTLLSLHNFHKIHHT